MFRKEIETTININASANKIWNVLINFEEYENWNSFIISANGQAEINKNLKITIKVDDYKMMSFKPKILKVKENNELCWLGKVFVSGIFDGLHYFLIKENNDGTCTFTQAEKFNGILIPFFGKTFINTIKGFEKMNEELKKRAENDL